MDPGHLVVTDLDGTLLGDDAALDRFRRWHARARPGHRLVYASGRMPGSVRQLIADGILPPPDAVISGVGTEIHDVAGAAWPGWSERFDGWHADRVRDLLRPLRWIEPQDKAHQSARKASYDVPGLTPADRDTIHRVLAQGGMRAALVYSGGRYLDILPEEAGKGRAARFLARHWSIPDGDVLAFGDSGNDLELLGSGFRGTMVANALPELFLSAPADVYRSPATYADGVLDGIRFWTSAPGTRTATAGPPAAPGPTAETHPPRRTARPAPSW
jgi:sucrose-6F-phosphate phosphohydrolase